MKDKKLDLLIGIRCNNENQFKHIKKFLALNKELTGRQYADILDQALQLNYYKQKIKRALL